MTVSTIGNEGGIVQTRMNKGFDPYESSMDTSVSSSGSSVDNKPKRRKGRPQRPPRVPLPPKPKTSPKREASEEVPQLDYLERDRRVDLRIPQSSSAPDPPSGVTEQDDERDLFPRSQSEALKKDSVELRFPMNSPEESHSPDNAAEVIEEGEEVQDIVPATLSRSSTGPVDVDNNAFLEIEKNLQAIHEVATEHLMQGELDEALEVFTEILRGQLTRYGDTHARVGTARHNIGLVQAKRLDFGAAVESYEEAVRIRRETLGETHPDVAVSLAQLGVAYLELNRNRRALLVFRESLKIRRQCYGNRHPKVAKILNNIGCALYELDELKVAQVAFEEALIIQRSLLKDMASPDGSETQILGIASTQCNLASIKLIHGDYDGTVVDLEEALLLQECVLPDDDPVVKKTQESLKWVEKTIDSPLQTTSSLVQNTLASTCLLEMTPLKSPRVPSTGNTTPVTVDSDDYEEEERSALSVMDIFEKRFSDFHKRLAFVCGGEGGNSDTEDDGLISI